MTPACLEFDLPFQVDVVPGKQAEFYVLIERTYRKAEFGMLHNDLIGRMSLLDQRCNVCINVVKFLS